MTGMLDPFETRSLLVESCSNCHLWPKSVQII